MVADTLALAKQGQPAKPVFTVLRSKDLIGEVYEAVIKSELESRYELRFISFETEAEMLQLAREQPFDLTILYLGNVSWAGTGMSGSAGRDTLNAENLGNVSWAGTGMSGWGPVDRAVVGLGRLRAQHGKPIIAMQGLDLTKRFEGTGVTFLMAPVNMQEFRRALEACLSHSRNPTERRGVMSLSRRTRPPRIVMLDDLSQMLELIKGVLQHSFKDATILTFTNTELAYQELMREDPDLFTIDICHIGMPVDEVLARLTERRVKYPVFVISAMADRFGEEVRLSCGPELNVSFWQKPFRVEPFVQAVSAALQLSPTEFP